MRQASPFPLNSTASEWCRENIGDPKMRRILDLGKDLEKFQEELYDALGPEASLKRTSGRYL
jgi:hypothetical protein